MAAALSAGDAAVGIADQLGAAVGVMLTVTLGLLMVKGLACCGLRGLWRAEAEVARCIREKPGDVDAHDGSCA